MEQVEIVGKFFNIKEFILSHKVMFVLSMSLLIWFLIDLVIFSNANYKNLNSTDILLQEKMHNNTDMLFRKLTQMVYAYFNVSVEK